MNVNPAEANRDPTPRKPDDYSDVGQAYVFAKYCGRFVRYSPATDYLVYDGICWQESKPRSQAAMQQFTDAQLEEAKAWLAETEERMEQTGANTVIAPLVSCSLALEQKGIIHRFPYVYVWR